MADTKSIAKRPLADAGHKHPATEAKLRKMIEAINHGRSKLYVAAHALDHGDTDLELQCATALRQSFEEIDEAYDELLSLRIAVASFEQEVPHG